MFTLFMSYMFKTAEFVLYGISFKIIFEFWISTLFILKLFIFYKTILVFKLSIIKLLMSKFDSFLESIFTLNFDN